MIRSQLAWWFSPLLFLVGCGASSPASVARDAPTDPRGDVSAPPPADDAGLEPSRDAASGVAAGPLTQCPVSGKGSFSLPNTLCSTLTPAEAGAAASGQNATVPSYAIAPDSGARGALLIWLNGSGGHPAGKALVDPTRNVLAAAASLGYAVLALSYPSDTSIGSMCKGNDECFFASRKSIILGVPQPGAASPVAGIAKDEGIVDRVARALAVLSTRDPSHGWGAFLASTDSSLPAEARIRWSAVTVAGHSQGGGHAAAIGKLFAVARVVQLSAACDNVGGVPASWTAAKSGAWASDPTQFYGLAAPTTFTGGMPTGGDTTCPYHLADWQSEGMVASHQNDAAATCGETGDTHGVSIGCTDNYDAWQAMFR